MEFHNVVWSIRPSYIIQVSPFIENGFPKVLRYVPLCDNEDNEFRRASIRAAQILYDANMIEGQKITNEMRIERNGNDFG